MRLQRIVQADDRPEWDRWARFEARDGAGGRVGFVVEEREWLGHTYGPATFTAVHNPTGEAWGARWRSEGHATAAEALAALAEHLDGAQ